jgi:hypothetical protein
MDTLSDAGFDMGDGDIDLDLGAAPDNQQLGDDALSLQDAGTDGGVDLQTATADPDDFMVDKDDLIEEDEIDYGDLELGDAGQPFVASPSEAQHTMNEQIDDHNVETNVQPNAGNDSAIEDDIIDYSDDEEEKVETTLDASSGIQQELQEGAHAQAGNEQHNVGDDTSKPLDHPAQDEHAYEYEYQEGNVTEPSGVTEQQSQDDVNADWQQPSQPQYDDGTQAEESRHHNQDHDETYGEPNDTAEDNHEEQADEPDDNHDSADEADAEAEEPLRTVSSNQRPILHPVTVNYDGTEMWLFKPHDTENGEWLLSDESVATQQFPYFFQACRAQLGDDLNPETELGLRFDHFHALELFEDCTACAYTTLKELLDVYLGLHAQDGLTDPEPFYITLQFRPRVLTLVNELKKAMQDQIGFSGLNDAVASGETSFNAYLSNHTEPLQDHWEENKHEEEGSEKNDDEEEDVTGKDGGHYSEGQNEHDASRSNSTGASSANASAPGSQDGEEHEDEPEEEELIDYSEDEGDVDATQPGHSSTNGPSSTSSTVQGDDASYANADDANAAENQEENRQSSDEDDVLEDNLDDPTDFGASNAYAQYDAGNDAGNSGHIDNETLDQAYDQGFDTGNFLTQDLNNNDGFYYDNDENAPFDQQDDFGLAGTENADDLDPAQNLGPGTGDNSFVGVDDFLDLTGDTGEDVAGDAFAIPTNNNEEQVNLDEEGAAGQATIDASSDVPPVDASSIGFDDPGSPQGLKRSIDEVDIGLDGAGETAGSYHYSQTYWVEVDNLYPDAKRPKV